MSAESIKEKFEIRMTNVPSFCKKLPHTDPRHKTLIVSKFIKEGAFSSTGPTLTASCSVKQQADSKILDVELLGPLDKEFSTQNGFVCMSMFYLTNAVSLRHNGTLSSLLDSSSNFSSHIREGNYQPITCGYNNAVQESINPAKATQIIVDICMGISPNAL